MSSQTNFLFCWYCHQEPLNLLGHHLPQANPPHVLFSPRRLTDTKQAALFLDSVNKHIWENNIKEKPTIYALDVKNFFPSVTEKLATD